MHKNLFIDHLSARGKKRTEPAK